jgi:hypothetical protein
MQNEPTTALTTGEPPRNGRSILAMLAGLLTIVILSIGTDRAMEAAGIFPRSGGPMSDGLFALATAYRALYSILGCYLAARLAPNHAMKHALILGGLGVIVSLMGVIATWNKPELGPHWYPIALVVVTMPCAWVGGTWGGGKMGARS